MAPKRIPADTGDDQFLESLMDTSLYSMGAYFSDEHPELVEDVIGESEAIAAAGLRAYAEQNEMSLFIVSLTPTPRLGFTGRIGARGGTHTSDHVVPPFSVLYRPVLGWSEPVSWLWPPRTAVMPYMAVAVAT